MNKICLALAQVLALVLMSDLARAQADAEQPVAAEENPATVVPAQNKTAPTKSPASTKKTEPAQIQSATINLQTTVTGNQEQPRVLYILPWQSPESPELGIEMLNSQQDAVFGHLEREELQRSLEAAGAMDQSEK